jgi:hypothetical protein
MIDQNKCNMFFQLKNHLFDKLHNYGHSFEFREKAEQYTYISSKRLTIWPDLMIVNKSNVPIMFDDQMIQPL